LSLTRLTACLTWDSNPRYISCSLPLAKHGIMDRIKSKELIEGKEVSHRWVEQTSGLPQVEAPHVWQDIPRAGWLERRVQDVVGAS